MLCPTLSIYKRWNNILLKLLIDYYKYLSEIAAFKKRLWSKVVVPKKHLFSCRLMCLIAWSSFFQSRVFLYFTKVVVAIHSSMDTAFFRRALATIICVYTMYLTDISIYRYFYYRHIVISKEHLQPYIWNVPSLFQ